MKRIILLLIIIICITSKAQYGTNRYGQFFIGNLNNVDKTNLYLYGLYVKGYPGLYMQHNNLTTGTVRSEYQMDVSQPNPCIAGIGGKIVFYRSETGTWNSIVASKVYVESDNLHTSNSKKIENTNSLINALNPVSFYWKTAGDSVDLTYNSPITKIKNYGFCAQEIEKIIPEMVNTEPQLGKIVNYNGLIPLLVENVKDLEATLTQNEIKLQELKKARLGTSNKLDVLATQKTINIPSNLPKISSNNASLIIFSENKETLTVLENIGNEKYITLDTTPYNAGIYSYEIITNNIIYQTGKIVILK